MPRVAFSETRTVASHCDIAYRWPPFSSFRNNWRCFRDLIYCFFCSLFAYFTSLDQLMVVGLIGALGAAVARAVVVASENACALAPIPVHPMAELTVKEAVPRPKAVTTMAVLVSWVEIFKSLQWEEHLFEASSVHSFCSELWSMRIWMTGDVWQNAFRLHAMNAYFPLNAILF